MTDIALYLIATPIGDDADLSARATRLLLDAKLVIGEEFRPLTTLLKRIGRPRATNADLTVLNEHSKPEDVEALAERVIAVARTGGFTALMSDCGTPGFCDPGAALVAVLRRRGVRSSSAPGPSALMCLLSLSGQQLREFHFRGFLPNEREERARSLQLLKNETRAIVLMDTPYRLGKLLGELSETQGARRATLGCDFTSPREHIEEGTLSELAKAWEKWPPEAQKSEFMILLHETSGNARAIDHARGPIPSRVDANKQQPFVRNKKK